MAIQSPLPIGRMKYDVGLKPKGKVIACIARELAGFIWALGTMKPMEQAA